MKTRNLVLMLATLLGPAVLSCSESASADGPTVEPSAATVESTESGERRDELFGAHEILQMMVVLNEGEVNQSKLAEQRARSEPVRAFAHKMVEDHTKALDQLRSAGKGKGSRKVQTAKLMAHQDELLGKDLETQPADAFDEAYMTSQLAAHAKALGLIEHVLIPSAQRLADRAPLRQKVDGHTAPPSIHRTGGGAEMLAQLKQARELVAGHLDEALHIVTRMRAETREEHGAHGGGGVATE